MDYKKIVNIKIEDIDYSDVPDFCDAFIASADYDGEPMTKEQLQEINNDRDFVYQSLMDFLY